MNHLARQLLEAPAPAEQHLFTGTDASNRQSILKNGLQVGQVGGSGYSSDGGGDHLFFGPLNIALCFMSDESASDRGRGLVVEVVFHQGASSRTDSDAVGMIPMEKTKPRTMPPAVPYEYGNPDLKDWFDTHWSKVPEAVRRDWYETALSHYRSGAKRWSNFDYWDGRKTLIQYQSQAVGGSRDPFRGEVKDNIMVDYNIPIRESGGPARIVGMYSFDSIDPDGEREELVCREVFYSKGGLVRKGFSIRPNMAYYEQYRAW